jgi:hypothetical protein
MDDAKRSRDHEEEALRRNQYARARELLSDELFDAVRLAFALADSNGDRTVTPDELAFTLGFSRSRRELAGVMRAYSSARPPAPPALQARASLADMPCQEEIRAEPRGVFVTRSPVRRTI